MKIRTIKPTLLLFFHKSELDASLWGRVMNCGDVLTWHMIMWLKDHPLDFPDFTRIEFVAVRENIGSGIWIDDERTAHIKVALGDRETEARVATERDVYDLLFSIVTNGILQLEERNNVDLSTLHDAMSNFIEKNYTVCKVLTERRPRGMNMTLRVEAFMDNSILNVFFVALRDGKEIYRELIQNSVPSQLFLWRRFKKIEVDGNRIFLNENLLKPRIPFQRWQRGDGPAEYYQWSKFVAELETGKEV
ncbi:MAG: hypothetical protein ABJM90_20095 [Paracoccaceae bacterium]